MCIIEFAWKLQLVVENFFWKNRIKFASVSSVAF